MPRLALLSLRHGTGREDRSGRRRGLAGCNLMPGASSSVPSIMPRWSSETWCLDATIAVLRDCAQTELPACLEQPAGSYMWHGRKLRQVLAECRVASVLLVVFGRRPPLLFSSVARTPTLASLPRASVKVVVASAHATSPATFSSAVILATPSWLRPSRPRRTPQPWARRLCRPFSLARGRSLLSTSSRILWSDRVVASPTLVADRRKGAFVAMD